MIFYIIIFKVIEKYFYFKYHLSENVSLNNVSGNGLRMCKNVFKFVGLSPQ